VARMIVFGCAWTEVILVMKRSEATTPNNRIF